MAVCSLKGGTEVYSSCALGLLCACVLWCYPVLSCAILCCLVLVLVPVPVPVPVLVLVLVLVFVFVCLRGPPKTLMGKGGAHPQLHQH